MTSKGGEPAEPEQPAGVPAVAGDESQAEAIGISQWEFIERVPTREEVEALVRTLPPVWGVDTFQYIDYVQALPQSKKVKREAPHPTDPNRKFVQEVWLECYTLYMSVAGRIKMLEAAQEKNGWRVEVVPEPFTPTGVPGYVSLDDRIVYREYVKVWAPVGPFRMVPTQGPEEVTVHEWSEIGSRHGTAWVPSTGGRAAAGSNPYEKVETSARGRAIGGWGFGVFPGSGVASVEEIMGVQQNRAFLEAEAASREGGGRTPPRETRQQLLERVFGLIEEVRQARGHSEEEQWASVKEYLSKTLHIAGVVNEQTGEIDWSKAKDGQIVLLANALIDSLRVIRSAGTQV